MTDLSNRIREHRSALWSERRNLRNAGLWNSEASFDEEIFRARLKLAQWHLAREARQTPREPRLPTSPIPRPAPTERLDVTIPGMPSPAAAFALREEEPFPLCTVRRLPGAPRPVRPQRDPRVDPHSAFSRMLEFVLKSRR